MNFEEVFQRFSKLCGLSADEAKGWSFLCSDAIEEVKHMLKDTSSVEENSGRLTAAAGVLSFYKYVTASDITNHDSFSAGDLRIDPKFLGEYAERIWQQAKEAISDLTVDSQFGFKTVKYIGAKQ